MIIVETLMAQDLDLGTTDVTKTHPGGGTLPGHKVSLSTFSLAGASGSAPTKSWAPPTIDNGSLASTTIDVPGAAVGDFVLATFSNALSGGVIVAEVSSANVVTVRVLNLSGASITLAAGTLRVLVFKTR